LQTTLTISLTHIDDNPMWPDFMIALDELTESNALIAVDRTGHAATIDIETDTILDTIAAIVSTAVEHQVHVAGVDELVTGADIAARLGRTRASVSQLINGTRGRGRFPKPINPGARHELYHWTEAQSWFSDQTSDDTHAVAIIDALLRLQTEIGQLTPARRKELAAWIKQTPLRDAQKLLTATPVPA
jgi:hypothetical protein